MIKDCLFCKIIEGSISSEKVFKDDDYTAFRDINPHSRVHVRVVPNRHIPSLSDCGDGENNMLSRLLLTANRIARELMIDRSGYRVVINSGENGGQLIQHLHLHLMGGEKLSDKMG